MKANYEYFFKFNWSSNPFNLSIRPELMVGYSHQTDSLLSHIQNHHKFGLLVGPTGSGKTTLLLWLKAQLMAYEKFLPFYISKPPRKPENLILLFKLILGYNFLDNIRQKNLTFYNIQKYIFRKLRKKHLVLLIDEAHEFSIQNLEWIRTIVDSIPNFCVIMAGLPVFENKLETKLPTLWMRINTKTYLNNLTRSETESLISKRIVSVGGDDINPFNTEVIDKIFETTGGFPREIIKTCDKLVSEAAGRNILNINSSFFDEVIISQNIPKPVELRLSITGKQRKILKILNETPNLTPSNIVEKMDTGNYKSKDNAIRSINNILKRLFRDDMIQRKKMGNSFVYFLSGKAKTMLTEA